MPSLEYEVDTFLHYNTDIARFTMGTVFYLTPSEHAVFVQNMQRQLISSISHLELTPEQEQEILDSMLPATAPQEGFMYRVVNEITLYGVVSSGVDLNLRINQSSWLFTNKQYGAIIYSHLI